MSESSSWRDAFINPFLITTPDVGESVRPETLLNERHAQYRNSRTGNARRAVSQPDHDILEGLPIRRWHKKEVNISTSTVEKTETAANPPVSNGYPERAMPKDWMMLPEHCQAILLAARRGTLLRQKDDAENEGARPGYTDFVEDDEKPGLLARKWSMFSKDFEPEEREFLAKRRKGLRSLYGGATVPINTTGQMRRIKIRNVDSEGNSQIVEALVPEGQTVDAEIIEEELTSPTQALAPGTRVEGVGIANSEGILVPAEQVTSSSQRRRPPPPKRRNKGPGRGRKKKVAFASGANGSTASAPIQVTDGVTTKTAESNGTNGVQSMTGDHDREDSVMQDNGQDGEDGSDDGSDGDDGEEGQKEEGEVSATPEGDDSKGPSILKTQTQNETSKNIDVPEPPIPPIIEVRAKDELMLDQSASTESKVELDHAGGSAKESLSESSTFTAASIKHSEIASVVITLVSEGSVPANPALHPLPSVAPTKQSALDPSTTSRTGTIEESHISNVEPSVPQPQQQHKSTSEQHDPPQIPKTSFGSVDTSSKSPPPTNSVLATENSIVPPSTSVVEHEEGLLPHLAQPLQAEATSSTLANTDLHHSQPSAPAKSTAVALPEPTAPPSESQNAYSSAGHSQDVLAGLAPPVTTSAIDQSQQATSKPFPIESGPARIQHHTPHAPTPEAPTPSPPTPLPSSFDPHQRERLMESPRAPTMSPPTPARDVSSSPDLPLAGHRELPPLAHGSAADVDGRDLKSKAHVRGEGSDGGQAPNTKHDQHHKGSEHPARFPDGEEDLLGTLERSLR